MRGQIVEFIQNAQDLAFQNYRASLATSGEDLTSPQPEENPLHSSTFCKDNSTNTITLLETFYQAPPPQLTTESLWKGSIRIRHAQRNSDSGYSSNPQASTNSPSAPSHTTTYPVLSAGSFHSEFATISSGQTFLQDLFPSDSISTPFLSYDRQGTSASEPEPSTSKVCDGQISENLSSPTHQIQAPVDSILANEFTINGFDFDQELENTNWGSWQPSWKEECSVNEEM